LLRLLPGCEYLGEEGWNLCRTYLDTIENQMAQILRRHSVFFWLHLYRRIGVGLSPEHGGKTDANTVGLVRQIVELAISKHGDKTRKDDLAPVSKVHFKDILGGHCQRLWQRWLGPVDALGKFRRLAATRQWVITQFEIRDFIDAYLVEGYAYEYWRVTALMRAVGKGSGFAENADDWPDTRESLSLSRLIISYDQRIATRRPFSTALLGSWFHSSFEPRNRDEKMLVPFYNIEKRSLCNELTTPNNEPFASNFLVVPIDVRAFRNAHLFLEHAFKKTTGVSLDSYLMCLWALANIALLPARVLYTSRADNDDLLDQNGQLFMNFLNILQRAYTLFETDPGLVDEILFRAEAFSRHAFSCDREDVKSCVGQLILREESRDQIALWSGGRRFPLIPFGEVLIIDLEGIPSLLQTLFYRVQHQQTIRGSVFEETFRVALAAEGFVQPQTGEIVAASGEKREVDATVRIGDDLFLFECRSIERPLDFELGRPRTLEARRGFLESKVRQVLSLRDFVISNPSGRNYDFRWAKTISAFVVSPFVEWIWDRSDRLWHSNDIPRILQADEAISYLHRREGT